MNVQPAPRAVLDRQRDIAAQATGVDGVPVPISYTDDEHATWNQVHQLLAPLRERYVAQPVQESEAALALPGNRIPQLSMVTERLLPLTGFRYASVAGTVPGADFFDALGSRVFSSTQFIRWSGHLDYTAAPDVIHEVGGHALSLAEPRLAEIHRLAGSASQSAPHLLTEIAAVFWYSVEFGVVAEAGEWKAYGTGLLSSPGELGRFATRSEIRQLDIAEMIATPFDINRYQPVLFGADSLEQVVEVVGSFYLDVIAGQYQSPVTPDRQILVPSSDGQLKE